MPRWRRHLCRQSVLFTQRTCLDDFMPHLLSEDLLESILGQDQWSCCLCGRAIAVPRDEQNCLSSESRSTSSSYSSSPAGLLEAALGCLVMTLTTIGAETEVLAETSSVLIWKPGWVQPGRLSKMLWHSASVIWSWFKTRASWGPPT